MFAVTVKSPPRRDATLKDVAKLAGLSTATVARVLHNTGYVAPETRRAVEAALAESGYRVNAIAQGLRTQRTFVLGHVLKSIAPNPFYATVALGAQQEAATSGCGVIVFNTQGDAAAERSAVETLLRQRVDAILFTTVTDDENVELALAAGTPVVQVERVGTVRTHAVIVDDRHGARQATEHLIGLGHQRVAFIGVDPELPLVDGARRPVTGEPERRSIDRDRLAGYRDALSAHGLPIDPTLIDLGDTYYSPERGRAVTRRLLALAPSRQPTAIFAGCDLLAAGVLQELYAQGLRAPEDLSVVGFDDTFAPQLAPALTTVAQPMLALGHLAARLALNAVGDGSEPSVRIERLTTELVVRDSTGPPRDR
jgi:LacI family transcriptional regulator